MQFARQVFAFLFPFREQATVCFLEGQIGLIQCFDLFGQLHDELPIARILRGQVAFQQFLLVAQPFRFRLLRYYSAAFSKHRNLFSFF